MVKSKFEAKSAKWSKDQHPFWQESFPESYCQMFCVNVHCTRRNDVFEIISSSGIPSHLALQKLRSKFHSFQSRFNLSLCNSSDGFSRVSAFIWNPMHLSGKQKKHEIWLNSFSPPNINGTPSFMGRCSSVLERPRSNSKSIPDTADNGLVDRPTALCVFLASNYCYCVFCFCARLE